MNIELFVQMFMMNLNLNLYSILKMIILQKKQIHIMKNMFLYLNYKVLNFIMIIIMLVQIHQNGHLIKLIHFY